MKITAHAFVHSAIAIFLFTVFEWIPRSAAELQRSRLWTRAKGTLKSDGLSFNRRLKEIASQDGTSSRLLTLNVQELNWAQDLHGYYFISLVLPSGEEYMFQLVESNLLPPALQREYPTIRALSGRAINSSRPIFAELTFSPDQGLHVLFQDGASVSFVDPVDHSFGQYLAYSSKKTMRSSPSTSAKSAENWSCNSAYKGIENGEDAKNGNQTDPNIHPENGDSKNEENRPEEGTDSKFMRYKFLPVANAEYSLFHGNTTVSVLSEIVTLTHRINGILKRELGIFFQLHEETANVICLGCKELSNDREVLTELKSYVENKNISTDSVDIAHTLTTTSGGVACVASICDPSSKFCAMTGLSQPYSDSFYVDYVLHEIGHQLGASHTFQQCGEKSTGATEFAVEPGGGSTAMAYAGICGEENIQSHSDPYFHAVSIAQIQSVLARQRISKPSCGIAFSDLHVLPQVVTAGTCVVPAKSYFQIDFHKSDQSNGVGGSEQYYYSIDSTTSIVGTKYKDLSVPRFRSYPPNIEPFRTFPHMYYILNKLTESILTEVLPQTNTSLTFRSTIRHQYFKFSQYSDSNGSVGFGYQRSADTVVSFETIYKPLQITSVVFANVGQILELKWETGGTESISPKVQILSLDADTIEHLRDPVDGRENILAPNLDWKSMGIVSNTGSTRLLNRDFRTRKHIMVRSNPGDLCFFFSVEIAENVKIAEISPEGILVISHASFQKSWAGFSAVIFFLLSLHFFL